MAKIIGSWKLNEGTALVAEDSSGQGHHGVLSQIPGLAPPLWVESQKSRGHALRFNGTNFVDIPAQATLEPATLTLGVWLRGDVPQTLSYIVSKGADSSVAASFGLYTGSKNGLAFYIYDGEQYYESPEVEVAEDIWNGEWFHAAATYDGSYVRLYIQGVEVGNGTPAHINIQYNVPSNRNLLIGSYFGASGFVGDIDEVMLWDGALSATEMSELAKNEALLDSMASLLPAKDNIIPLTMLLLRRFLNATPPSNSFEEGMQQYLAQLPSEQLDALTSGLGIYDSLPTVKHNSIFNDHLGSMTAEAQLEPGFILKSIIDQSLKFGNKQLFDYNNGIPESGKVRPWTRIFPKDPDSKGDNTFTAPYPWICELDIGADNQQWYKNKDIGVPGNIPLDAFNPWDDYLFAKSCRTVPDFSRPGMTRLDCETLRPPAGDGPFAFEGDCHGHSRYNFFSRVQNRTVCLTIPLVYPNQEICLRGLNFFSQGSKIRLRKIDSSTFQELTLDCSVFGDQKTPEQRDGRPVASYEVKDIIRFRLPEFIEKGFTRFNLPPGRYAIRVVVPNDINFVPVPGVFKPSEFVSNEVWVDLQPNPDIIFGLWTDEAFCHRNTSGPGSDEPWFQAFVARFVPNGSQSLPSFSSTEIMNTDDVDSNEPIAFPRAQIFRDKLAKGEVFAVALIGLEVDSEDAAREQIAAFGAAYGEYWKQFYTQLGASTAAGVLGAGVKEAISTGAVGAGVYAGGIALVVVAVLGIFYALWADADPIGYDFMVFDATSLHRLTDPTLPLPNLGDNNVYFAKNTSAFTTPRSKVVNDPGGTQAVYSEDHDYYSREEDSHYRLVFRVDRSI